MKRSRSGNLSYKVYSFFILSSLEQHLMFSLNLLVTVSFLFISVCHSVWDLGGQTHIRTYWRLYYADTNGIIFVVDAADNDRLTLARDELHGVLQVCVSFLSID